MHHVAAGYLPGDKMRHAQLESSPGRLPQCIELIDTESRLRNFLHDQAEELAKARVVLYRCELLLGAAVAGHS